MKRDLYLLCGGRSRRMGEPDKMLLRAGNESLLDLQIRRGKAHFGRVTLLSGENTYERDVRQLPDAIPDAGPLSGLLSALRDARQETIALVPVDVPLLTGETLSFLASQPLPHGADVLVAESDTRLHPLVGIFAACLANDLAHFLHDGERSVRRFTERIEMHTFSLPEDELCNVNTPADYERLLGLMDYRRRTTDD